MGPAPALAAPGDQSSNTPGKVSIRQEGTGSRRDRWEKRDGGGLLVDAAACVTDDVQINSSCALSALEKLFPLLFPACTAPPRGEATFLVGTPSPWQGGHQQRMSILLPSLSPGVPRGAARLRGHLGSLSLLQAGNTGLGKGLLGRSPRGCWAQVALSVATVTGVR